MKTRILTGTIGILLVIGVLFLPSLVLYCAVALLTALAVYEMFTVTGLCKNLPLLCIAEIFALVAPFFGYFNSRLFLVLALAIFLLLLVGLQLRRHHSQPLTDTALAFFLTVLIAAGMSCMVYCRSLNDAGLFYFLLNLVIAWGSDTGAYFIGIFFGKHKLCPDISPKKSVEGFFGGWVTAVLASFLLAYIWQKTTGDTVIYWQVGLLAVVFAPLSVPGDLFASVIKRQCGAKDYGNIMPGHGGVMDRFDSLLFVAPPLYVVLHFTSLVR